LSGGELFDRIADDNYKMTEAEVIKYIRQVVAALKHMHENNIVHLDIKVISFQYVYYITYICMRFFNILFAALNYFCCYAYICKLG